jgi:hypothetical protein
MTVDTPDRAAGCEAIAELVAQPLNRWRNGPGSDYGQRP